MQNQLIPIPLTQELRAHYNLSETCEERFWAKVNKEGDCWEWAGCKDSCGYGSLSGGIIRGHRMKASRFCWIMHHGGIIPPKMEICHSCDNPGCVNPSHLFIGTHRENMLDMFRKGRRDTAKGERQHSHKFTAEIVLQIRSDYAQMCGNGNAAQGVTLGGKTGMSHRTLAAKYGVNRSSIRKIVNRMTWKHI